MSDEEGAEMKRRWRESISPDSSASSTIAGLVFASVLGLAIWVVIFWLFATT